MGDLGQSWTGPLPGVDAGPVPDWDPYLAWRDREIAAGRDPEPGTWPPAYGETENPLLPEQPENPLLPEQADRDFGLLSDNELIEVLQAARRQQIREQFKQVLVMAEFGRRRMAAFEDAKARGVPSAVARAGSRARNWPWNS